MIAGRRTHRALDRIADRLPHHRGASARFDSMVVTRKSWGYWFVAQVAIAASLAGCEARGPGMDKDSIADRASIVRVCPDGSVIGRDPVSGRYVWGNGWTRSMIAPGLMPDQVCGGKR